MVERRLRGLGIGKKNGALPEVVEEQAGHHQPEPRDANRSGAEVAHVRVERFPTGDDEKDGAEHDEPVIAIDDKELDGVGRIDRLEHSLETG